MTPNPRTKPTRAATVQERIADFRASGLPVEKIAEMARVERRTVRAWLAGTEAPRGEHVERVSMLHTLLDRHLDGNYRVLNRLWRSRNGDGPSLRDFLTAETLEHGLVRRKIEEMSEAVARYARIEAARTGPTVVSRDNAAVTQSVTACVAGKQ